MPANDVPSRVEIYDTTLRDGAQLEGISLTVDDKLRIAEQLDWLGVHYIEAGWPGSNPKDDEAFRRIPHELKLQTSKVVAFGSTRRVKGKVDSDDTLRHLLEANTEAVCIVGKSWDYHVTEALQTTLDEGAAMVADSVEFLRANGRQVLFDAEHFFDGYRSNPEFALRVLEGAAQAGASHLVLCDTNGGTLPHDVERVVREVVAYFGGAGTFAGFTAQTTNAPPAVVNAPSAASGTGATFASNEDPAHEAAESPEREAEENSGKGFGHHGFNEDPAHEAGESPEREAQEDAGNAPSAGAPASNSGSSTLQ